MFAFSHSETVSGSNGILKHGTRETDMTGRQGLDD